MTYIAKVGDFSLDTSWTQYSYPMIQTLGFQPKAVLFIYIRTTVSGNILLTDQSTYNFGVGVASERTAGRFTVTTAGFDEGENTGSIWKSNSNASIIKITDSGSFWGALDSDIDFNSFTSSGIKLYVVNVPNKQWSISYLALGGTDLSNTYSATKLGISYAGSFSVTDPGFKPDALFIASADYPANQSTTALQDFSVGFADSNLNQSVVHHGFQDWNSSDPYRAFGYAASGEIRAAIWRGNYAGDYDSASYYEDTLTSLNSNGFTLWHQPVPSGTTYTNSYYNYLAMKGGKWKSGGFNTRTDGNDIVINLGFRPVALIFTSANRPQNQNGVYTNEGSTSIGIATSPTERRVIAVWNDYVETTYGFPLHCASAKYTDAVYANIRDDTLKASMDLKSMDDTGFTCVMDTYTESGECWVSYLAWGYEEPALPASRISRATVIMI